MFKKCLLFKGSLCKSLLKEVCRLLLVYQIAHYRPAAEMCTGRMKEAPSLGETPMAVMLQPSGEVGMVQQQLLLRFVKQIMTGYNRRAVKVKSYV